MSRRVPFTLVVVTLLLAACGHTTPVATPYVPTRDPNVTVFRSDRQSRWEQFRLGGGLNVVVANANLPAAPAWRFSGAAKGTSSSPVIDGDTIFLPANDHRLYALSAANGQLRWTWQTDNELMSSPVYEDHLAVLGAGNADCLVYDPPVFCLMGLGHNHLDALDTRTGKPVWRFEINGTGMPSPALARGMLLHFDGSGVLKALDAQTGGFRWRHLLYSIGTMSNVLLDGRGQLFVSGLYPNAIYSFRVSDGAMLWKHRLSDRFNAVADCPLALGGSEIVTMYLAPSRPGRTFVEQHVPARQHVYALDASTGLLRWDTLLPNVVGNTPPFNESAVPLIVGSTVYDGSAIAPIVTALDLRTGRVKWQLRVSGPVKGGLVDRDGVLYFGDLRGTLWALNDGTGLVLGSVKTDLAFNVGSPIVVNDSLVIGSQQGPMIAVPLAAIRQSHEIDGITTSHSELPLFAMLVVAVAILLLLAIFTTRRRPHAR